MFWTLVTILYLIILNNQVIATVTKADTISAEFISTDWGCLLNITWEDIINPTAVKIESLNETCKMSCLIYPENTTTLLIPPPSYGNYSAKFILEKDQCLFVNDCWYNIKLETIPGITFWNKTLYFSECIHEICLDKDTSECPKITLGGKFISANNIRINWSVNISQMIMDLACTKIEMNKIVLRIYNLTATELAWGGKHILVKNKSFPLNISAMETDIVHGYWNLNSESMPLSKHFAILAHITDFNNCDEEIERFKLMFPNENLSKIENTSNLQKVESYKTVPVVIVAIVFAIVFLIIIFKIIQNSKFKPFWKNTYHSIVGNQINLIPMESNILYMEGLNGDYYEIYPNKVTIIEKIDSGAFGQVYKGSLKRENGSNMIVAIKSLKKERSYLEEEFLSEIETMKNVGKHEHVVELLGCCTKQLPMMMIMEYVGGGNLLKYLKHIKRKPYNFSKNNENNSCGSATSGCSYIIQSTQTLSTVKPSVTETLYTNLSINNEDLELTLNCEELHNFAFQIAKGMQYLEEKEITHRDLAARNILITEKKILKISDFGLSRNGIYVKTTRGEVPLRWLSIEAIRENFYSSKSDVWAFGIVLWEIGTLGVSNPYPDVNNHDLLKHLLNGNRLDKPEICSDKLYNLMIDCWKENLAERPSFANILEILKPEGQYLYIELNSLGSNYVFSS